MVLFASATAEDIPKSFPTNEIEEIKGRPAYATLKPLMKGIKEYAEVIPSEQVKSHFYLVVSNAEFLRVTTTAKIIPVCPPTNPVIAPGATQFHIAQVNWDNDRNVRQFHSHLIMIKALKR